jgi:hypothetical protein
MTWIKEDDQLPEVGQIVLLYVKRDRAVGDKLNLIMAMWTYSGWLSLDIRDQGNEFAFYPTHWTLLPEKPQ